MKKQSTCNKKIPHIVDWDYYLTLCHEVLKRLHESETSWSQLYAYKEEQWPFYSTLLKFCASLTATYILMEFSYQMTKVNFLVVLVLI